MAIKESEVARSSTAAYIGGPLNGGTVRRAGGTGPWAHFRDDDGSKIPPARGMNEMCRTDRSRYYVAQPMTDGNYVYVHLMIYSAWMSAGQPSMWPVE